MNAKLKHHFQCQKRRLIDAWLLRGYRRPAARGDIVIETTNACTLRCTCCPNGISGTPIRPRGVMSRATFDAVLAALDLPVRSAFLHMCGEPTLCADLPAFARRLADKGIQPVLFSNGLHIDMALLEDLLATPRLKMAFSMDLLDKPHYERIRVPARYEEAEAELARLDAAFARAGKYFGLNVIVNPDAVARLEADADRLFATYPRLNNISLGSAFPWPGLPQTGDVAGHLAAHAAYWHCAMKTPSVLWNGDVSFCNLDYQGATIIGNVAAVVQQRLRAPFPPQPSCWPPRA